MSAVAVAVAGVAGVTIQHRGGHSISTTLGSRPWLLGRSLMISRARERKYKHEMTTIMQTLTTGVNWRTRRCGKDVKHFYRVDNPA